MTIDARSVLVYFLQKEIIIEDCRVFVNPYEEADEEVMNLGVLFNKSLGLDQPILGMILTFITSQ